MPTFSIDPQILTYYIIVITVFSFLLNTVDFIQSCLNKQAIPVWIFYAVIIIGGSLGSLLAHYFWDAAFALYAKARGLHKVYMDKDDYHEWRDGTLTQQTLTILILIFHVFICLWLYNVPIMDTVSKARKWLSEVSSMELLNRIVAIYLVIINIITFITFGIDKRRAVKDIFPRIRIRTLLILAAIGGSVGGILGMKLFRHKTRKKYFSIGMPLILIIQIFLLYFLFYKTV